MIAADGLVLGTAPGELAVQYGFLIALNLFLTRSIILTRIGSMRAVRVTSRLRLVLSLLACNFGYLLGYHLLLAINPDESWWRLGVYAVAAAVSVPVFGMPLLGLGYLIERGAAVRVLTSRYKPGPQPDLVDLTKGYGRNAQLIPRGGIAAYVALLVIGGVAALVALIA